MSFSTKWLLGILVALVVGAGLVPALFDSVVIERRAAQEELARVSRQLQLKERAVANAEQAIRECQERSQLSLGADLAKARVVYQEYLVQLTDACVLSSVMVTSSQPERLDAFGSILHFTVQASGTSDQFGRLIDGFHRTPALHRMSHLSIFQSLGPESATHSLTMDISLLVLDSAQSNYGLQVPQASQLRDCFTSTDIFRKQSHADLGGSKPSNGLEMLQSLFTNLPVVPASSTPPVTEDPPPVLADQPVATPDNSVLTDPKEKVRLVGIIKKGEVRYAIFFDVQTELQVTIDEQKDLNELGIQANIVRILDGEVHLAENNRLLSLNLGELYCKATHR